MLPLRLNTVSNRSKNNNTAYYCYIVAAPSVSNLEKIHRNIKNSHDIDAR